VRAAVPPGTVFVAEGTHDSPANVLAGAALVEVRGTREYVGAPASMGGSGAQAEQAIAGSPTEDSQFGGQGRREVGSDQPHPAETGGADDTAAAPPSGPASSPDSGSREATGGAATGEGEASK
jgi:hypothetical protein